MAHAFLSGRNTPRYFAGKIRPLDGGDELGAS